MDTVHMRGVIPLIADGVLPEPPLPNSTFPSVPRRMADRNSPCGIFLENAVLIACHRAEKSTSPPGRVHRQCRWSGNTIQASI